MKVYLYILLTTILLSCTSKTDNINKDNNYLDTIKNKNIQFENIGCDFNELSTDTFFTMYNDSVYIKINTICTNDNAITNKDVCYNKDSTKTKLIRFSNYKCEIFYKSNHHKKNTSIDKSIFKDSVDKIFLSNAIITHPKIIRVDSINKKIFLSTLFGIPRSDYAFNIDLEIDSIGKIKVIKYHDFDDY